ncbi:MAG: AAA family ATPase [Bacteroidota bacterium]|nr:AAA family ATPase [Bacteroidota bacterium]
MLQKIEFENYKAFRNGSLEIRPINILIGANSVGKSSVIQLFLMLQETALNQFYNSPLKLYGNCFSLGEGINLFRKKKSENNLEISLSFKDETLVSFFQKEMIENIKSELLLTSFVFSKNSNNNNQSNKHLIDYLIETQKKSVQPQTKKNSINSIDDINIKEIINKVSMEMPKNQKTGYYEIIKSILSSTNSNPEIILNTLVNSKNEIFFTYEFLETLKSFNSTDDITISYSFSYNNEKLYVDFFTLAIGNYEKIKIKLQDKDDIISFEKFNKNLLSSNLIKQYENIFTPSQNIFKPISDETQNSLFNKYILEIINRCLDRARQNFISKNINYVSPLRAYPKRYYFLDKAKNNSFLDTLDGESIAQILKDNPNLKKRVNQWFKRFNLYIEIGQLKDIIHQIEVNQYSLNLDLTDVGFGVSQILPVIIQGFLSIENSLTLIEQPEIHLHPKMQADLADLFIDIALNKNGLGKKYLLIETHSEYLLKRLRRRISEKYIQNTDIGLYYVEHDEHEDCTVIRMIDIQSNGSFEYPKDFYSGDLADDINIFLKNQL